MLMLVGGILFEIVTGVLNIQYDYIFGFSFYTAHYFGAWVFIAGFLMHIAVKIPRMIAGLRSLPMREVLRTNLADTRPEPRRRVRAWWPTIRTEPTMSRRGALALVGGRCVAGRGADRRADPRRYHPQAPPCCCRGAVSGVRGDFPINKTAVAAGISARGHRRELAVDPARRALGGGAGPRHAGRHAAAHRAAADRLRRRLVDGADLERGAAGRSGAARPVCRTPLRPA